MNSKPPIISLLLLVLLVGCETTRPTPLAPSQRLPDLTARLENRAVANSATVPKNLALRSAKRISLLGNPGLHTAAARVRAAQARVRAAQASFRPTVDIGYSATHSDHSNLSGGAFSFGKQNSFSPSITAHWVVFDGFLRDFHLLAQRYGESASEAALADSRRLLLNAVAQAFYTALLADERVRIAEAESANNKQFLADTSARRKLGSATESDVLNFELRLHNASIAQLNAARDAQVARLALIELMGQPASNTEFQLVGTEAWTRVLPPDPKDAVQRALALRPDLQRLHASLLAAETTVEARKRAFLPQVSIASTASFTSDDPLAFDNEERNASIGISLNWRVFDGGQRQAAVDVAQADLSAAGHELESQWHNAVSEIRQRIEAIWAARSTLALREENVRLSTRIYEQIRKRYRAGVEPLTRVNEVLTQLTVAERNLATGRIALAQAIENLHAATGENLLDFE
jgi:outer membrane protein